MEAEENKAQSVVDTYHDNDPQNTFDVLGSYTGNSNDGEEPDQDGDDI